MKDKYAISVAGVLLYVSFNYEPAEGGAVFNDPESLELLDLRIMSGSLLDLLDAHKTTAEIIEDVKYQLYKQIL